MNIITYGTQRSIYGGFNEPLRKWAFKSYASAEDMKKPCPKHSLPFCAICYKRQAEVGIQPLSPGGYDLPVDSRNNSQF